MSQVSSTKKLLSASAVMASGTLVSRALGMLRVILIAFILGNGTRQADIVGIASMVPNALYILFAGGALNTVLVPQIVRAIKYDDDGGEAFTNRIMTAFMLVVGVVSIAAVVCAPLVTMLYSSNAWRAPDLKAQYASMVALTYLTLPQIFFYGAFFLLAQVLNARDKFGPMMWAPIANNVLSILVLSLYLIVWGNDGDKTGAFTTPQILLLGLGSTLGIAMQTLVLLPFLKHVGFKFRPRFDLKGTGLGHTFSLTKWTLGFVAVNQAALVVVNRLATTATAGGEGAGVNVYSNAHLLWILPHSLVTTSLTTAMLSNASRLAADRDLSGVAAEMMKTARLALVFLVPSTAAFLVLSTPTASILFGHGRGSDDAAWVGMTLIAFAVGLIPFTIQFVCLRTYYALEDTRTPFLLQIGIASVNAGAAILLVALAKEPGRVAPALALSYSIAYIVGVFVSWQFLRRKLPQLHGRELVMHVLRLVLSTTPGAILAWFVARWLHQRTNGSPWADLLALTIGGIAILGSTALVGKLLQVRELRRLGQLLRRPRAQEANSMGDGTQAVESSSQMASWIPGSDDDPPTMIRPRPVIPGDFNDEYTEFLRQARFSPPPDFPVDIPPAIPAHAAASASLEAVRVQQPDQREDCVEIAMDEASDIEESDVTSVVLAQDAIGSPGMLLGVRYQLEQRFQLRARSESWLAHDQVLDRDVVAHLMARDDPDANALLSAAQRGAAATDSRFLRVLDVDTVTEGPVGVYAICEHAYGLTLGELIENEPFTKTEGAFVVKEVADALTSMHAQGLFHAHLNPEHILITRGGSIRIVGFGTAAVLEGGDDERPWSQREAADVMALGAVLRATQTGFWDPSPEAAAPDYALSDVWEATFDGRILTMQDLVDVLPYQDASALLDARLSAAGAAGIAARSKRTLRNYRFAKHSSAGQPTIAPHDEHAKPHGDDGVEVGTSGTVPRRPALWALIALAVLTLIIGLLAVAIGGGAKQTTTRSPNAMTSPTVNTSSGSPSPTQAVLQVHSAKDFDPEADGGNDEEFPDTVARVIDGDASTTWTTMRYLRRPTMGGLKPGVGIVLDLGEPKSVTAVDVTLVGKGETTVELRVPSGEQVSMKTEKDWKTAAPAKAGPAGTLTLTPSTPVKAQYLLVYLTSLPPVDGGFAAEIAEIQVHGT